MALIQRYWSRLAIALGIGLLILAGCDRNAVVSAVLKGGTADISGSGAAPGAFPDFIALVTSQGPAVVSIRSTKKVPGRLGLPGLPGFPSRLATRQNSKSVSGLSPLVRRSVWPIP